jgi:hypothetical protein
MGLIFAVHELKRCQNDLIFTVTSLRPTEETRRQINDKKPAAWNYGDYQFYACYEKGDKKNTLTGYHPKVLASIYQNGLVVRWTVFIPEGFGDEIIHECKLELYYLYTCGKLAAKRKAAGLPDRKRIKPIAVLPLPEAKVELENQLSNAYDIIKSLEPVVAEKHLVLKSIPFTDKEMDEFAESMPGDGISKRWKEGDKTSKTSRLSHKQTKKPSQIEEKVWIKDRLEYIEN